MSRPNLTLSIYPDSGVADYITLGLCSANYLVLLVLTVIAIHNRDFLPIKAKQLWVLCLLYYRMYRVIIQGKKFWEYQFLVIMVFMIPALIVCVIIEALKLSQFNDDPTYMACYVNYYAQIGIIATFVIYLAPLIYLTIALRNVQRGYGDYIENRKVIFSSIITFILYVVFAVANLTDYIWGRCLVDFLIIFGIDFIYYFILGKPLYGCLFDREKCLLEFKKGFQMETFSSNLNDASQSQSDGV